MNEGAGEEFLILDFVSSQPIEEEVIEDDEDVKPVISQLNVDSKNTETSREVEVSFSLLDSVLYSNQGTQSTAKVPGAKATDETDTGTTSNDTRIIPPGRSRAAITRCLEPDCNFQCTRIPRLRVHLEEAHGIVQEMKEFTFENESSFKEWLNRLEQEARCAFMRRRGWQINKSGSMTACYYCNRGGLYVSSATKKQAKTQGSCKTGVECTASMKVTKWPLKVGSSNATGQQHQIEVEAYLQHYGHNLDLSHIRITKSQKDEIARKLSQGISKYKILDEIRGSLDPATAPQRVHLLSLQDMYNIERKEGIQAKRGKLSCEPGTTVQAWIEKMQQSEDNPVLLIKYQQEKATPVCACLSNDDFLLVLQTSLQSMMLRRYGPHQCICMDITQGQFPSANPSRADPNFHLMALEILIPNSTGADEVLPVAWFVSNRKDKDVVEICLTQIRNNLSDLVLTPSYLITPTAEMTAGCDWFDVWTSIFGSGPRRIIGSWHIIGEWHRLVHDPALNNAAKPLEGKRLVANLNLVMRETVPANFVALMKEFLDDLGSNVLTKRFGEHFKRRYASQPELWSRAYRSENLNKAESRFDLYHQRLAKNIYHEGFKRKQLDVLIKTLMKHSRDKAMTKLRQSFRMMSDGVLKRLTTSKHDEGSDLPLHFVKPRKDGRSWSVICVIDRVRAIEKPQTHGEPMRLTQVAVERIVRCDTTVVCTAKMKCPYRCSACEACSHQFTCTCNEPPTDACSVTNVLCEHCHLVCRYLAENGRKVSSLFVAPESAALDLEMVVEEEVTSVDTSSAPLVVYVTADDVKVEDSVTLEPAECAEAVTDDVLINRKRENDLENNDDENKRTKLDAPDS